MRSVLVATGLFLVGMAIFEVTMRPTPDDRMGVALILGLMAAGTVAAAQFLARHTRLAGSLRNTVIWLSLLSFLVVALGIGVASQQMFLSPHDLSLLLVFLGFGAAAALAFGLLVSRPLGEDLQRIAMTARAIADGELDARANVLREDEVGVLAAAVDEMADALEQATLDREAEERAQREFFAAAGHDLRTPLASLRAALEAVQDGVGGDPERFFTTMDGDISAMSRLVDDISELAKIDSGHGRSVPTEIDLTEIADEAISIFAPIAAKKAVSLDLDARERVMAFAGSHEISRVVRNLVDNAVRHAPSGTNVSVVVRNGDAAQLEVVDQGSGFSADLVDVAFERFSRGDQARHRATGGSGLGLAIARGYVTAYGGSISATVGKPGTVVFTLPKPGPN